LAKVHASLTPAPLHYRQEVSIKIVPAMPALLGIVNFGCYWNPSSKKIWSQEGVILLDRSGLTTICKIFVDELSRIISLAVLKIGHLFI
jgi:hypothetical protein